MGISGTLDGNSRQKEKPVVEAEPSPDTPGNVDSVAIDRRPGYGDGYLQEFQS